MDGLTPVDIDAGFEVAPGDASDIEVANADPWDSNTLVFSDGSWAVSALGLRLVFMAHKGTSFSHTKSCIEFLIYKTGMKMGRNHL